MANISKLKPFDKIEIVRRITGISSTQKLILLNISTHLGKNDFCFLSLRTFQKECCIINRTNFTKNLKFLIDRKIIWKLPPGNGFKSNRYGINFNLVVSSGYHLGTLGIPVWYPQDTSVVSSQHPKRNINKIEKKIKEESFIKNNENTKKEFDDLLKKMRSSNQLI